MTQVDDLSRSLVACEQNSTMAIVVEMSQSSWLVAGVVAGLDRRPLKKVDPNPATLLRLLEGWREQAVKSGQLVSRIVLAFDRPHFEHVVGLSLDAPAVMRFRLRRGERFERANVPLEPRGAYHLRGEARHEWEHSITEMEQTRWSVTFRSLVDGANQVTSPHNAMSSAYQMLGSELAEERTRCAGGVRVLMTE